MKTLLTFLTTALLATSVMAEEAPIPAGNYTLDHSHSSLVFTVNHLGFSSYTSSFDTFDATLKLDPVHPEKAEITATIDPRSLDLPTPPKGFTDELLGEKWLNTAKFPKITFASSKVEMTGKNTADVHGTLELLGVKRPVTLKTTFNGGWEGIDRDPNARAGFSATTSFKRSDFGLSFGVPEAGSTMGVGDEVKVQIETEFSGPAMKKK